MVHLDSHSCCHYPVIIVSEEKFVRYFEALSELKELTDYEKYLIKIIHEAEKELSLEELSELAPHIRVIIRKTVDLREKERAFEVMLSNIMPKYRKLLKEFNEALSEFLKLKGALVDLLSTGTTMGDEPDSESKIWELRDGLLEELERLKELKGKEEFSRFAELIDSEIRKVEEAIRTFDSMNKIISPNLEEIERARKYIGYTVQIGDRYRGYVGNVYYTIPSFDIVLRIYDEEPLSESDLQEIHNYLYNNLIISITYDEFKSELIREMKVLLGVREDQIFRPSFLKIYFKLKKYRLNRGLLKKLKRRIKNIGFVYLDDIKEIDDARKNLVVENILSQKEVGKLVNIPSVAKPDWQLIGKRVVVNYAYNYSIYYITWLPKIGMSAILLRRDPGNIPIPDPDFVKKILMYMETKGTEPSETHVEEDVSEGDLYWKLRVLVMRTLSDVPEITESKSLQPKYIFEFALRRGIPIAFSELYQTYFTVIPIDILKGIGENTYIPIVPFDPIPLKKLLNRKEIKRILGDKCPEFIGLFVKKEDGIILECCSSLTDDVKRRLKREFKLEEKFFEAIKGDVRKLIRSLILSGLIKSRDKYNTLLTILNKKEIKYDDIVKPFYEDIKTLLRFFLISNIQME